MLPALSLVSRGVSSWSYIEENYQCTTMQLLSRRRQQESDQLPAGVCDTRGVCSRVRTRKRGDAGEKDVRGIISA